MVSKGNGPNDVEIPEAKPWIFEATEGRQKTT